MNEKPSWRADYLELLWELWELSELSRDGDDAKWGAPEKENEMGDEGKFADDN